MRPLALMLLPVAGLVLACRVEEPTAPAGPSQRTTAEPPLGTTAAVVTMITAVDQAGDMGRYTSLASGSDGRQHITYLDASNLDLKYATCASACGFGSSWTNGAVDQSGSVGQRSSLKIGSNGRLHVLSGQAI